MLKGVNIMLSTAQCIAFDKLSCRDIDWYSKDDILYLDTKEKSMVLFIHGLNSTVICSGKSFQVFVWDGYKYTLWQLSREDAMCVIEKNTRLDYCNGFINVIENAESEIKCELGKYGKILAKLLEKEGYVVFIAQREGALSKLPNVIVNDEAESKRRLIKYLGQRLSLQSINHLMEMADLFT